MCVFTPVQKIPGIDYIAMPVAARRGFPQAHQPVRFGKRKRSQQHGVDDAENRAVGADPQSQREYGDERESRAFAQQPQRVAKVASKVEDAAYPARLTSAFPVLGKAV